ncbi:MAG: hypothetical protein ACI9XR_002412 [Flavobacterium sp.]|jgi:hypothetical protein
MKAKLFILFVIATMIISCTSDSNNGTSENYLPLITGNFWKYSVSGTNGSAATEDSLYIANDTTINATIYKKFKARNFATGLFSSSLNQNAVKEIGSTVVLTGLSSLGLQDIFPLNIDLVNFVLLNSDATSNTILSTVSGTIDQNFEGFPITITYTLKSINDGVLPSYNLPNGVVYNDIVKTKLIVNLSVSSTQTIPGTNFPIVIPILNAQDVLVSNQYYAKNIGMVYNKTNINFTLNPTFATQFNLPANTNQEQIEFLNDFEVN